MSFAHKIGKRLKGGEVIELRSDVGGGKTTFVRGVAKGFGSTDQVASPTFTISRIYDVAETGKSIHHFDFYRLDDAGLMRIELGESVANPDVVTIIEWAGIVDDVLPEDRLVIELQTTGDDSRLLRLRAGKMHTHLLRDGAL